MQFPCCGLWPCQEALAKSNKGSTPSDNDNNTQHVAFKHLSFAEQPVLGRSHFELKDTEIGLVIVYSAVYFLFYPIRPRLSRQMEGQRVR